VGNPLETVEKSENSCSGVEEAGHISSQCCHNGKCLKRPMSNEQDEVVGNPLLPRSAESPWYAIRICRVVWEGRSVMAVSIPISAELPWNYSLKAPQK